MQLKVYCKVNGLGVDENDNAAPVGVIADFGEIKKDISYEELTASINKERFLELACLDGIVKPEDVEIITPEEYYKEFAFYRKGAEQMNENIERAKMAIVDAMGSACDIDELSWIYSRLIRELEFRLNRYKKAFTEKEDE